MVARPPLPTGAHALRRYINGLSLDAVRRLVRAARHFYYNTDDPLFDDDVFDDVLLARLSALSPEDPVLDEVGAEPSTGGGRPPKVKLPYPMPSLPKIKPGEGAAEWLEKQRGPITASDKMDGLSAQIVQRTTKSMYSRGRGVVGQDITPRLREIRGVGRLKVNTAVRGELIFLHTTFAREFHEREVQGRVYKNARNLMSGVVNTTRAHPGAPHAVFVVHEQLHPHAPLSVCARALKSAGWLVVPHRVFTNPTLADITAYLEERKRDAKYEIDGLVLENARGEKIAFKMDAAPVEVEVETVQWKLSQFGVYKPTVKFKRALRIGGVDVTNPNGHNARFVVQHGIGPGAVVKVIRAGDVIPKIVGTTRRAKPNFPPDARWKDGKKIDIVPKVANTAQARLQQVRRMETGLRVLGIEGVRETSVDKLYGAGFQSLPQLFNASPQALSAAGLGAVFTRKLTEALRRSASTATHPQTMQASGCWPSGFTTTRFEPLNARLPFARMLAADRARLTAVIAKQAGWSAASAAAFTAHLDAYATWLEALPFTPADAKPKTKIVGALSGKQFVFSKVRDKRMEEHIRTSGGEIKNGVTANTTALVVASRTDTSTKITAAKKFNVPVLTLEEFDRQYGR